MNQFDNYLSGLSVGEHVRITQTNGQVLEGVIVQNDGTESFQLQVTMKMFVRYRAVDSLAVISASEAENSGKVPSVPAAAVPAKAQENKQVPDFNPKQLPVIKVLPSKDMLYDMETNEDTFKKLIDGLSASDKALLEATANSLLSAYESNNEENMHMTAVQISQLAQNWKIEDSCQATKTAAAAFYLAGDYQDAVNTLYFHDCIREAYLTAFNASYRTNEDVTYHRMAASLSVLYLLYSSSQEYYEEASACLRDTTIRCKDISGVEFFAENMKNDWQKTYCYEVLKRVCDKLHITFSDNQDVPELIALVKGKYNSTGIVSCLLKLERDKIAQELKTSSPDDVPDGGIKSSPTGAMYDTLGEITKLNFFEDKGKITGLSGKVYDFEFNDIPDANFRKKIKSMAGQSSKKFNIPVRFEVDTSYSKSVAINITAQPAIKRPVPASSAAVASPVVTSSAAVIPTYADPNQLFSAQKYTAALQGYQRWLEMGKIEEGFCGCVQCYLKFMKMFPEKSEEYMKELRTITQSYEAKLPVTIKSYSSLLQAYAKIEESEKSVAAVDKMLKYNIFKDESQKLHFMITKAGAWRRMGETEKAIEALEETCIFVEKNHLYEKREQVRNITYVELAEMYADIGNYQQAQYYLDMSGVNPKKDALRERIRDIRRQQTALKIDDMEETPAPEENLSAEDTGSSVPETPETDAENAEVFDEPSKSDDSSPADTEEESDTAENGEMEELVEYTDEEAFDRLIVSDEDIFETAFSFGEGQLDCMLTYLAAAAYICQNTLSDRKSSYLDIPLTDSIVGTDELVNAAFATHGFHQSLSCDRLMLDYLNGREIIPEYSSLFFIAAALRAMFSEKMLQTFEMDRMIAELEKITPEEYSPRVLALTSLMQSFKTMTGYSMDVFADYNTRNEVTQTIIRNAEECREYIDGRVKSYESQGRLRRAREMMFHDKESIIAVGLDIVCEDRVSSLAKIKRRIIDTFMRNEESPSVENIDVKKLDLFIDTKWDIARDNILSEKKHVNRPYDNLKGGRRNNIIIMLKRAIDCICQWINVSENAEVTKDVYSLGQYTSRRQEMLDNLYQLSRQISSDLEEGFDWGLYSIGITAEQMIEKLEGTYQASSEKYMFINFLRTNHILLDEDYIPDITSTFSDLKDFDIFSRIKAYAASKMTDWKYRIQQIFSNNIHNNNFRSVELICSYGEAIGDKEITEHPMYENLEECIRSGKKRTTYFYKDFKNELELDESYGSISDAAGYKTFVGRNIDAWYSAAIASGDFGFFSDLMDVYRQTISENAEATAVKLMKQLKDLADDSSYDFGIYTVQQIRDHIEDRNFAIAENILNCIRRSDTKMITDFTREPKSHFDSFMAEYDVLYRAVSDTKINLQKSLMNYYGKKSIELVLRTVTNNINKDVRGGIALINSWPVMNPAGEERISKFVSLLGFTDAVVTRSTEYGKDDVYMVRRAKKTGKITYPHPIPAFGSLSVEEGFRVLVLYGRYDTDRLIDKFHEINTVARNTIVILDSILNQEERRRFARKIKEEKSFARSFIIIDRVLLLYLAKHYQANTISRMLMAITMPFSYNQPYCPKPNAPLPPELFTGRTEELTKIEAYDGVNLVYGGRQLGKSSLLHRAALNIDKNASGDRAIVINIRELNYTDAARMVSQELVLADILPEGSECDDWDTLTMHIKKRLKDESETRINYLLLMLDEADEFIGSCQELRYRPITNLKSLNSPRFKFVLAGLHNLSKYDYEVVSSKNSDISHLESVVIRPFRRPEATELLTHALAYLGFIFSDDVINLILAKTNYFPGLIHLYAQKLIAALTNDDYAGYSEMDTPYYYVTESHIKKVLADQNFKDEINEKLRMTLEIKGKENSPYYIIGLILAYLYYESEDGTKTEFTVDDIINKAKSDEINVLMQYTREQIEELMHEMWDLNILSAKGDHYMFSTEGFRELLGTKAEVNSSLSFYMGGSEA